MRLFLMTLLLSIVSLSSHAADFSCTSSTGVDVYLFGLEGSPIGSLQGLSLSVNTMPKDSLVTAVTDSFDAVSIEFVNLEIISGFSFIVLKSQIADNQFSAVLFEVGSPGSSSQNHILNCVKQ